MALLLQREGYRDVLALRGGWEAWLAGGYPTEPVPATVVDRADAEPAA